MKLYKGNSLIEEINNVGEFDKGLKGVAEVDFADAVIRTRDKEKEINDTLDKHFTKDLKEIDNTEKDRTEPHKVTSPDLKKMHLSESLFEDWEEDDIELDAEENLEEGIFKSKLIFTIDIKSDDTLDKISEVLAKRLSGEVVSSSRTKLRINVPKTEVKNYIGAKSLQMYVNRILTSINFVTNDYNKKAKKANLDKIGGLYITITLSVDASLFKKGKAQSAQQMKVYSCYLGIQTSIAKDSSTLSSYSVQSSKPKVQDEDSKVEQVSKVLRSIFESATSDSSAEPLVENVANDELNSKVYNALKDIAFYYHGKGIDLTEKDFELAWEWFATHFADEAEWSFTDIEESLKGKSGKTNLADKLRAKLRAKKESMINEDLVIIAGVEDFKPSSELAQKVLDIVMQNDKLGEFDQICEKMFPEGAKSEDINDVLESEDGKWVIEMLDLDPNVLNSESEIIDDETVEVTDDEVEA